MNGSLSRHHLTRLRLARKVLSGGRLGCAQRRLRLTPLAGVARSTSTLPAWGTHREAWMADGAAVRAVAEVMSTAPVTAVPSETIAEAAARMADNRVGSVIVVDGDRPIGILTERDLVRFGASAAHSDGTKVSEWMTEDPDCIGPDVSVHVAFSSLA